MRYNFFISNSVVSIEIPAFVKNINVKLFEYAWFIDFHEAIEDLKSMAMEEDWTIRIVLSGKIQY